jgi:uncharacterized protein GlcG (DUF336 family)
VSPVITPGQASALVDAALARGAERGLAPLTVAVLDPGGRMMPVPGGVPLHAAGLVPWLE